ncbi:MAG: HAMP domain-containing protein, partial [Nitrospirae bacterium]
PVWGGRAGTLHLGYSLDYLERELKETTQRIITAILITILLFGSISIVVTRWLTGPLIRLTELSERFARGDYSGEIIYSGDDEIGKLCHAFERMRDALNEREAMLKKRGAELEEVNIKLHEYIQELDRTREELIRIKQDTTVQETVGAVLHHLRQPLTVLTGYAEMLADDMEKGVDEGKIKERAKKVFMAGMRLNELLKKFESLKTYRVVKYGEDVRIVDIDTDR